MVWGAIGYTSRSPLVRIDGLWIGPSLMRKSSAVGLACTFTRSLANRKRLIHGCRATGSSPYASHYD
ncbi:hypothetical protein TNCV_4927851 [Trichonephila clavipes]|nr:hypothetical protein TNCV_4927851 [Trichonephila clavipes]